jgi:hypothetical protein
LVIPVRHDLLVEELMNNLFIWRSYAPPASMVSVFISKKQRKRRKEKNVNYSMMKNLKMETEKIKEKEEVVVEITGIEDQGQLRMNMSNMIKDKEEECRDIRMNIETIDTKETLGIMMKDSIDQGTIIKIEKIVDSEEDVVETENEVEIENKEIETTTINMKEMTTKENNMKHKIIMKTMIIKMSNQS